MSLKRNNYTSRFKAKVALEAIKGEKTLAQLSSFYKINSNLISKWKKKLLEGSSKIFESKDALNQDESGLVKELYNKIGKLTVERDFLQRASGI